MKKLLVFCVFSIMQAAETEMSSIKLFLSNQSRTVITVSVADNGTEAHQTVELKPDETSTVDLLYGMRRYTVVARPVIALMSLVGNTDADNALKEGLQGQHYVKTKRPSKLKLTQEMFDQGDEEGQRTVKLFFFGSNDEFAKK